VTTRDHAIVGALSGLVAAGLGRDLDLTSLVSFWGDRLMLIPLGALVGAACGATRLRTALHAITAALFALWLAVAYTPLTKTLAEGLIRADALKPADAVLVLATRMQADGEPTSAQMARLYRGLELVKDGFAPRLIISELPPPYAAQRPFAEKMLARFGPDVELVVLQSVRNTHDEAVGAAEYMKAHGLRRIIVTSSPTHTFRGAALLETLGLETLAAPAAETTFDIQTLDRPEERMRAFGAVIHERLGIVVYRRRGWIR
jgi:uncharacterized SAM-binding protein YcdF (DUF218 family)